MRCRSRRARKQQTLKVLILLHKYCRNKGRCGVRNQQRENTGGRCDAARNLSDQVPCGREHCRNHLLWCGRARDPGGTPARDLLYFASEPFGWRQLGSARRLVASASGSSECTEHIVGATCMIFCLHHLYSCYSAHFPQPSGRRYCRKDARNIESTAVGSVLKVMYITYIIAMKHFAMI